METRTKIVCTLGPASADREIIIQLIREGMDVCRLNFSHTSPAEAAGLVSRLKAIRAELGVPLSILLDTKGPEVRVYGYREPVELGEGDLITVRSHLSPDIAAVETGEESLFLTNLPRLAELVQPGRKILLMDGFIEGEVTALRPDEQEVDIRISNPGRLRPKAHLTIPKADYPLPFLSDKDREDIVFAVENELDYLALSFVKSAGDVQQVRNLIHETDDDSDIRIIAKVENKRAVDHMDEIIRHSDGIMVARGDLGVELEIEEVPIIQKQLIRSCYLSGKPVITATQMLESMMENPIPTRAEASDVANACYDQTSAVMLSGETAIGRYPVQVVRTMRRIVAKAEESIDYEKFLFGRPPQEKSGDLTTIVTYNALTAAYQANAKAIAVVTRSGYSARMLSRLRPGLPLYAFTYDPRVYHQLALNWGIQPILIDKAETFEELTQRVKVYCEEEGLAQRGDLVVFVAGLPLGKKGTTNMIRIETVGKTRIFGKCLNDRTASGEVTVVEKQADLSSKEIHRRILLLKVFRQDFIPFLKYARGIVMETDDHEGDLSVLGLACGIPVLLNAHGAVDLLREGSAVEIDGTRNLLVEL
jgi:pyruvate kinase